MLIVQRPDAADMVPVGMHGSLTTVVALNDTLAQFDGLGASYAWILETVRDSGNISTSITTKKTQK